MTQTIRVHMALQITDRYVCSRCYGMLLAVKSKKSDCVDVVCGNSLHGKCNGNGFVTRSWAERRRAESKSELWEARQNYPDLEPKVEIPDEQILSELGF